MEFILLIYRIDYIYIYLLYTIYMHGLSLCYSSCTSINTIAYFEKYVIPVS